MADPADEVDVARVCVEVLGDAPTSTTTKRVGVTYLAEVGNRIAVVKFRGPSGRSSPLVEAWVYQEARKLGLRVPEVLGIVTDPDCMVATVLPGRSLWKLPKSAEHASAWAATGADLRALHEIRLTRFGPLHFDSSGDRPTGNADSWSPFIDDAIERGMDYLAQHEVIPSEAARTLTRRLTDVAAVVSEYSDGRLLHGDLEGGHIYVSDHRYVGMIDFDQAQVGDPRWDLARVTLWDGEQALDWLLDGYGSDIVTPEERRDLLPVYLFACVIHHAVQAHEQGRHDALRELLEMSRYERLL